MGLEEASPFPRGLQPRPGQERSPAPDTGMERLIRDADQAGPAGDGVPGHGLHGPAAPIYAGPEERWPDVQQPWVPPWRLPSPPPSSLPPTSFELSPFLPCMSPVLLQDSIISFLDSWSSPLATPSLKNLFKTETSPCRSLASGPCQAPGRNPPSLTQHAWPHRTCSASGPYGPLSQPSACSLSLVQPGLTVPTPPGSLPPSKLCFIVLLLGVMGDQSQGSVSLQAGPGGHSAVLRPGLPSWVALRWDPRWPWGQFPALPTARLL